MPPKTVAALIEAADRQWGLAEAVEITLEANPSSVEASRFSDIAAAGVNRISLGLQALHDETLRFLGRAHDVAEGLAALDLAQRHYARVSFDLIYALPDQSEAAWEADLRRALGFGTEHLSLYQLTIEPGTRFATLATQGTLTPMAPDPAATLFEMTDAITREAGLFRYEVSNHARSEAQSRHNLAYWRYQNYVGIGPGAHGRRHGVATVRHKKPENWMSAVRRNGHGLASEDVLTRRQRQTEAMLMGLRLAEGVDLDVQELNEIVDRAAVRQLEQAGLLTKSGSRLQVTSDGMLLLNSILNEIIN
jgi:oxygen-independent coproporphyrinogen-3 oxidase